MCRPTVPPDTPPSCVTVPPRSPSSHRFIRPWKTRLPTVDRARPTHRPVSLSSSVPKPPPHTPPQQPVPSVPATLVLSPPARRGGPQSERIQLPPRGAFFAPIYLRISSGLVASPSTFFGEASSPGFMIPLTTNPARITHPIKPGQRGRSAPTASARPACPGPAGGYTCTSCAPVNTNPSPHPASRHRLPGSPPAPRAPAAAAPARARSPGNACPGIAECRTISAGVVLLVRALGGGPYPYAVPVSLEFLGKAPQTTPHALPAPPPTSFYARPRPAQAACSWSPARNRVIVPGATSTNGRR